MTLEGDQRLKDIQKKLLELIDGHIFIITDTAADYHGIHVEHQVFKFLKCIPSQFIKRKFDHLFI